MRKVYQNETKLARLPVAVIFGVGFTAVLFGFIPFAHRIAKPERSLELRTTSAVELPPPVEEEIAPPPPEPESEVVPPAADEPKAAEVVTPVPPAFPGAE